MLKSKIYTLLFFILLSSRMFSQCPQVYDYLGNLSSRPYFVSCTGASNYVVNFSSNVNWGSYTIIWGDGSTDDVGSSYFANSIINHTYNSLTPDTFEMSLIIPSLSCTLTGVVVMEKPVNASIQIPIGGVTTICAPKPLLFTNSSTDVSETTVFTWDFGDGSPVQTFDFTNVNQTISHNYLQNTVNCQTAVTLTAKNYCTSVPTIAQFNPIQIYDYDDANITPSAFIKCWPDNTFSFTNSTNRNCVPQGNTFQRQERWNFFNYWGMGHDSIVGWKPWPPSSPMTISYPSVGSYNIMLEDSNLCGIDTKTITVTIVNPPSVEFITQPPPLCQGVPVTFSNTSGPGYIYKWNFGDGGGFVIKPFGTQFYTYNTPGTYTVTLVALVAGAGAACTDTAKTVITILPKPAVTFSVNTASGCSFIYGVNFTEQSSTAISWSWNFGNGNTFIGQNPPSQNYTTTGVYTASLSVSDINTCTNSFTLPINVYHKPIAKFTPTVSCVNSLVSFSNTSTSFSTQPITNWHWNFGDAVSSSTSSVQNPTHTYTIQNTYMVQLIVNTANCGDTIEQTMLVNIKPTAQFTLNPLSGCPTLTVNFTNNSTSATTYTWNFGNGNGSSVTNPTEVFTNSLSVNKTYSVVLTAFTAAGCSDSYTNTVTVFSVPKATFTTNVPLGCSPIPATFTNTSTGASSYLWSFGDGATNTSTTAVLTHTYINNTLLLKTFSVQLLATSANGCKDSTLMIITTYPKPIFNFTMIPTSGCSPLTVNFPPVLGAVSYTWDYGDGSPLVFVPNPTHTFTNNSTSDVTYSVQLIATNAFSCADTTFGYPVVYAKPQANFVFTPSVGCSPLLVNHTNTSIGATNYNWRFGDGFFSNTNNTSHTYTNNSSFSNQTFSCTLVASTSNGCKDSIVKNILVYYKPQASFVIDTPRCLSKTITYTNTSSGTNTYQWTFGDFSAISSVTNPNHTFTNTTTGNLTFTTQLIATSTDGCKDTAYASPIIYATPSASFVLTPTASCSPLNTNMANLSQLATSYVWKFGDGNTSSSFNTNHNYTNSSTSNITYSCTLIAVNNSGCKDSLSKEVTVYFNPKASFIADTPSCSPKLITFTNTSVGGTNYQWNMNNNTFNTTQVSQSFVNTTSVNVTNTVQLIAISANNCKDTLNTFLITHPKPEFKIVANPDSGCAPLTVNFPSISGVNQYQWQFGDGNISNASTASNIFYNNSQSSLVFTVQLIGTDEYGCKDTAFKPITVFPKPVALFQANPTLVFVPNGIVNCNNISVSASSYIWSFGDNSNSTEVNPSHTYYTPNEYQISLIAISNKGCKDTFLLPTKIVAVLESDIDIPNAFTPNPLGSNGGAYGINDMNNDVFHPVVKGVDKYEMQIYSRWGELLFVSTDTSIGWDGYYKGKLCMQDVYVWKINATTVDGRKINKTGDVLLLK